MLATVGAQNLDEKIGMEALHINSFELQYYTLKTAAAAGSPNGKRACVINVAEYC